MSTKLRETEFHSYPVIILKTFPILSPVFLWNATEVISRALWCASTHFYKLHEDGITSADDCNPRIQASNQVTPGNAAQATDGLR